MPVFAYLLAISCMRRLHDESCIAGGLAVRHPRPGGCSGGPAGQVDEPRGQRSYRARPRPRCLNLWIRAFWAGEVWPGEGPASLSHAGALADNPTSWAAACPCVASVRKGFTGTTTQRPGISSLACILCCAAAWWRYWFVPGWDPSQPSNDIVHHQGVSVDNQRL